MKNMFNLLNLVVLKHFGLGDFAYYRANQECLLYCFKEVVTEGFSEDL